MRSWWGKIPILSLLGPFFSDLEFTHTRVIQGRRKPAAGYARVSGTLHRTVSRLQPMRIG